MRKLLAETPDKSKLILSCAGGMPPGVSTENIRAFIEAARARASAEGVPGCPFATGVGPGVVRQWPTQGLSGQRPQLRPQGSRKAEV